MKRWQHSDRSTHKVQSAKRTSSDLRAATFYALSLNRPFFLWGPPQGLSQSDDPAGERYDAWQKDTFPQLTWDRFDGHADLDLAARELGKDYLCSPEELRRKLWVNPEDRWRRGKLYMSRMKHALIKKIPFVNKSSQS